MNKRMSLETEAGKKFIAYATTVKASALRRDPAYQRDVEMRWVQKHLPFDVTRAGAIVISSRDGGPYVVDGWHRVELALGSKVEDIIVFQIDGMTQVDEAELFVDLNGERRGLTALALWKADLTALNRNALDLQTVVQRAGYRISADSGPRNIKAIEALRWVQKNCDLKAVSKTLELVDTAWFDMKDRLTGQVLKGLAEFIYSARAQQQFDERRLLRVLNLNGPARLRALAGERAVERSASTAATGDYAAVLAALYNKGLRKKNELQPLTVAGRRKPSDGVAWQPRPQAS